MPQRNQTIDLSAGMVPRNAATPADGGIDLSAGMVPWSAASQPNAASSFLDASGASGIVDSLRHPVATAGTLLDAGKRVFTPGQPQRMSDNPNPIIRGIGNEVEPFAGAVKNLWQHPSIENARAAVRKVPIAGTGMQRAQSLYDQENTPAAIGAMLGTATGLAAPELLKAAPRAVEAVARGAGGLLQDAAAARMDRFLNGGKRLPVDGLGRAEYDAPGRTVLEQGPATSFASNRQRLTQQIADARAAVGPSVGAAYASSQARIPLPRLRDVVDGVIDPMRKIAGGPGGNPNMGARFDQLRESFGPNINLQGTTSPGSVHEGMRTLDKNINWNRGPDPLDATVRNASRQIRGGMRGVLNEYAPEGVEPSNRYRNLSDAMELSADNQRGANWRGGVGRLGADALSAVGTTMATGRPTLGLSAAAVSHILPPIYNSAPLQTGIATGLFQTGRAINAGGRMLGKATPLADAIGDRAPAFLSRPAIFAPLRANALQPPDQTSNGNSDDEGQRYQNSEHIDLSPGVSVPPPRKAETKRGLYAGLFGSRR